jgi:PAS/PAC sensor signal transduction histidine kinase (EC 2.7.13.3)
MRLYARVEKWKPSFHFDGRPPGLDGRLALAVVAADGVALRVSVAARFDSPYDRRMKRSLMASSASVPEQPPLAQALTAPDCLPGTGSAFAGVDEAVWIEVIHKMDDVYNDLLQYEVVLEQKNAALEDSQQFIESVLASMSDILIVCNRHGAIDEVNDSLRRFIGQDEGELRGRPLCDLFADEASRQRARDFFSAARRRRCRTASCGSWGEMAARCRSR